MLVTREPALLVGPRREGANGCVSHSYVLCASLRAANLSDIEPLPPFRADNHGTGDLQMTPWRSGSLEIPSYRSLHSENRNHQ